MILPRTILIRILLAGSLVTSGGSVLQAGGLLDPVTTFTNGMPMPSTTSLRSSNVNYKCDPNHRGCCDGRYNLPCWNSLVAPHCCECGARRIGSLANEEKYASMDGMEPPGIQNLGTIARPNPDEIPFQPPSQGIAPATPLGQPLSQGSLLQQVFGGLAAPEAAP